jgi:hypothetical protein
MATKEGNMQFNLTITLEGDQAHLILKGDAYADKQVTMPHKDLPMYLAQLALAMRRDHAAARKG